MSLRAKIILIFLGLSVVPLAALSFLSYTNSIRSLKDLVQRDNRVAATDLQRRVSQLNGEIRSRVEDVARLPELQTVAPGGLQEADRAARLARAMQARVSDRWSYFSDLEFQPVAVRRATPGAPAQPAPAAEPPRPPTVAAAPAAPPVPGVPAIASSSSAEGSVVRVGDGKDWSMKVILPDLTGMVAGQGAPTVREYVLDFKNGAPTEESLGRMQGDMVENLVRLPGFILQPGGDGGIRLRNLFDGTESTDKEGGPIPNSPPLSPETGLPASVAERRAFFRRLEEAERRGTQAIRMPVRNPSGEIGTVVAHIRPDRLLAQIFDRTTLEEGEIAFAVDPSGRLHGSTPADLTALAQLGLVGHEDGPDGGAAGGALTGDASAPAISADPEVLAGAVRNPEWISVIERDEQTGYVFGIVRPVGRELERIRTAAATNLMLGFAFIGLAGSGVIVFSHRVTRGLGDLSAGARRIAGGDLSHRIASLRRDEVGQLASAFNDMAMNLEESRSRLVAQERVQRELEIARSIQRDSLPHGELGSSDLDIAGRSISSLEVGGDFFNVLPLGGRRTALLIGDVVGKGVPAALLMAELQATLRTLLRYDTDVERVMGLVNTEMARDKADHIYLTGFLGVLDHTLGTLVYVNAGHPPALLLRATGGLVELGPTARPIGMFEDSVMTAHSVEIGVGDLLLLYTDGVVECSAAEGGEFYGGTRLQSLLRGAATRPLARVLDELEERLKGFHGPGSFDDDATFVVARVRTAGEAVRASSVTAAAGVPAGAPVGSTAGRA